MEQKKALVDSPFTACYNLHMNEILRQTTLEGGKIFQIIQGDITTEQVDAIVNPANANLAHGGGVAGIIARKGGPVIQQESDLWVKKHGPVSHESPAYTTAGNLQCKYVIHAVGPIWGSGNEDAKLSQAINGSLQLAEMLELRSIAMPAISTGIFGFPKERAARILFEGNIKYFKRGKPSSLEVSRLVLFDPPTVRIFLRVWDNKD